MAYRIEQEDEYLGNDRWHWRAWIGAPEAELDAIGQVTWYLHHTFADPVVKTDNRQERFAIERNGWGTFQLRADVHFKDGRTERLRRELQLYYPASDAPAPLRGMPPPRAAAGRAPPPRNRVFLSYGVEDRQLAATVRDKLVEGGYRVLDASQVVAGQPWQASLQKMMRESDLVLGLVTSEFASPNLVTELNNARRADKPAIALVSPGVGSLFGLDHHLARTELDLDNPASASDLLDLVERSLADHDAAPLTLTSPAPRK